MVEKEVILRCSDDSQARSGAESELNVFKFKPNHSIRVGCAGWSLPKVYAARFPTAGTHLARYACELPAVEINSSFYRPHKPATYTKWAESVPEEFRFAVKVPREATHARRLVGADDVLDRFLPEATTLGEKLGPLLVQLPPSLKFSPTIAGKFFMALRERFDGDVVLEPRHASWFETKADKTVSELTCDAGRGRPGPGRKRALEPGRVGRARVLPTARLTQDPTTPDSPIRLSRRPRGEAVRCCGQLGRSLVHLRQHGRGRGHRKRTGCPRKGAVGQKLIVAKHTSKDRLTARPPHCPRPHFRHLLTNVAASPAAFQMEETDIDGIGSVVVEIPCKVGGYIFSLTDSRLGV